MRLEVDNLILNTSQKGLMLLGFFRRKSIINAFWNSTVRMEMDWSIMEISYKISGKLERVLLLVFYSFLTRFFFFGCDNNYLFLFEHLKKSSLERSKNLDCIESVQFSWCIRQRSCHNWRARWSLGGCQESRLLGWKEKPSLDRWRVP